MYRQDFEKLRGCEINLKGPMESVPCIETSDEIRLCKHPVVSVHMITYNHEPFIRQAIEGVMMQKTDFEFELIIGEDCSQDRTREICFEYQKRYPDKIRVLWWHENVSKLGGNSARIACRYRGEYIAYCEGDDYWVDPLKLQKQVDVFRSHSTIALAFGARGIYNQKFGTVDITNNLVKYHWPEGVIRGVDFNKWEWRVPTLTAMVKKSALQEVKARYNLFQWRLLMGDVQQWYMLSLHYDFYCSHDLFGIYRSHAGGVTKRRPFEVHRDTGLVRLYVGRIARYPFNFFMRFGWWKLISNRCFIIARLKTQAERKAELERLCAVLEHWTSKALIALIGPCLVVFPAFAEKLLRIYDRIFVYRWFAHSAFYGLFVCRLRK